jgi:hypothetical protein
MTRRQRDLARLAREHGWQLDRTRRHFRLRGPRGATVIASASPSCRRDLTVTEAELRRAARRRSGERRP